MKLKYRKIVWKLKFDTSRKQVWKEAKRNRKGRQVKINNQIATEFINRPRWQKWDNSE